MFYPGELEVRARDDGARLLRGRFPYMKHAVLSDGGNRGRPVKERFRPGAFAFRVGDPVAEVHLLVGHDYNRPLASKLNGTLSFADTALALIFEAVITPRVQETSYARDILALVGAGLAVGVSPGFRMPPKRTVPDAERMIEENPAEGRAMIREISDCLLYELSIVTAPAYHESIVEELGDAASVEARQIQPAYRWRHV